MGSLRRLPAVVFAGDRRVWRAAAIFAVPFIALTAFYCLRPRFYFTGTESVENAGGVVEAAPGAPVCEPGLRLPAGTSVVRLQVLSASDPRPALHLTLRAGATTQQSTLPPLAAAAERPSNADFPIAQTPAAPTTRPASLCVSSDAPVHLGGTPLTATGPTSPTQKGAAVPAELAIWYLPKPGARSSYVQRIGKIFDRAALFRPGIVGAWTYPLLLFVVLPLLALLALRCLALAIAGRGRRMALWLFAIAALNASCWALITPVFQGPDEVDHFAYVQSLVERGEKPINDPQSAQLRWSSAEYLALEGTDFLTDHQVGDTRAPWLAEQQRAYETLFHRLHPHRNDGGGYTTSATHGPPYYLALAPAYLATAHASIFSQLTLMRISSALLGALVVLFTFLLARELAPRRPWLAVLAALLVAYEPMFGFISGIVNNDVGVNAAAAALELLLIRLLRRGITIPWGALTGAVLILLPSVKGTGLSLYPVAALVFLAALWRHHRRNDLLGWAALALAALLVGELATHVLTPAFAAGTATPGGGAPSAIGTNANAASEALHHLPDFLSYLWQVFLPKLPFMTAHFPTSTYPGFVIFIERGWAAFGWYDVLFPSWVYSLILAASLLVLALAPLAAWREWGWLRRHAPEALAVIVMPIAVIVGFVAAYYTPGARPAIAEFGRYAFPAIGPIALLVVGALHAFGRRWMPYAGVALLVAMLALSYSSQLLTLTGFYA
ncbi:MAG TPA: phospholipid carrier-dependent glycosyltransferase [Solirubrobacteraceae bacterium]|nr:phospholipid carrier-dependent glycosyltransferase [Solirubrobacteraceae bacterium]